MQSKLQGLTLASTSVGIACIIASFLFNQLWLGYTANLILRIAGFAFMSSIERPRVIYSAPLFVATLNTVVNSAELLFAELLVSSLIFQFNCIKTFKKDKH